jgi:hypothetical protein
LKSQINKVITRKLPNLIIVAGDGRNSGKTGMCCKIISESNADRLKGIKISPHFHQPGEGMYLISEDEGYLIYEELSRVTGKDSAEMLRAGAEKVYYIQTKDRFLARAFEEVLRIIPEGDPIVCESPALINHFDPGVFIIMVSDEQDGRKDITEMKKHEHLEFSLSALGKAAILPFSWSGKKWILL